MADEPQREIEKVLSDYAARRREEAGATPPLHPATRRMLQGEAAREWPRQQEASGMWMEFFTRQRVRFVSLLVVVTLAGVVAAVLVFRHEQSSRKSAFAFNSYKNTLPSTPQEKAKSNLGIPADSPNPQISARRELSMTKQTPSATDTSSLRPMVLDKDKSLLSGADRDMGNPRLPEAAPAYAVASGTVASVSAAPASPPVMVPAATPSVVANRPGNAGGGGVGGAFGFSGSATNLTERMAAQKFARVDSIASDQVVRKKLEQPRMLSSFRFETTGNQVRIIEADGSIYTGTKIVESENRADSAAAAVHVEVRAQLDTAKTDATDFTNVPLPVASAKLPVLSGSTSTSLEGHFAFRVSGTNISTGKLIVFDGQLNPTLATRSATASSGTANSDGPTLLNRTLSGQVTIDGTNQIQINAAAVK